MRGMRAIGLLLAGLLALLLAAIATFWWWAGTEGSLAWVLRQVGRSQPLVAEGVAGSLRAGARIQRLQWRQDDLQVEARDVALEWKPLELLLGAVQLDRLHAASVRIEDQRPPSPKVAPQSLAIRWRPAVDDFKLGRLEWISRTASVTATDIAGHYSFNGAQHQVQLDSLRWGAGSFHGRANVGATGTLPVEAVVDGRFHATVPGAAAALPLDFSVTLRGPLADLQAAGRLQVGTGSPAAGTRATATARLTPWAEQPVPQARADVQQLDVALLWPQAPHTSLAGQVTVQPAGTASWALSADLRNTEPGPWDRGRLPVSRLRAEGEWRAAGQALVHQLRAEVGGGELQARGEWRGSTGWGVEGRLQGINPAALHGALAPVPVGGTATVEGEGTAIRFEVDVKAQGGGAAPRRNAPTTDLAATVQALELRQASARGRWDQGLLSLPSFEVRTADAQLGGALELRPSTWAGGGRLSFDGPGLQARAEGQLAERSGSGTGQLVATNLAQAQRWLQRLPVLRGAIGGMAAAGRGDVQVAWQGGWRDPALQARASVPLLELREAAAGAAPVAVVRDVVASVNGRLSDASIAARARAEQGPRKLEFELAGNGGRRAQQPAVWQGRLASLRLAASDPAIGGGGTWSLGLQQAFDLRWSQGSLEAGAGQALLTAPAQPNRPAGAPATLAWDPLRWRPGELQTSGRLTGLPMGWIELLGGPQLAGSALSGDLVFEAQWDASLGATPRLRASLGRTRGDVSVLAENAEGGSTRLPAGVRDAQLAVQTDGEFVTASLRWDSERAGSAAGQLRTRLVRGGAMGWQWPDDAPLSGVVRAQLPRIGVWSLLAPPGWRLRGSLAANVSVAGTRADPQLSGTVSADDLALRSVVDGVELQGGRLRARLEGQRLLIDEFMLQGAGGTGGGGTLVASGEGAWTRDGPQLQLAVQITSLRASIRSDRQLTVSGQLAARVDAASAELTGTLKVDQAHIQLPDESKPGLGDDVVVRRAGAPVRKVEAQAAEQARPGARQLRLAVDLDLGQNFRVQGQGVDTRLRGTLAIAGQSLAAPRVTGVIRTVGGEYRAYGQRLDIERGVLRFTGRIDNPSLDILAIRPRLTQRVGVEITGSVLIPYVRLYSEPELPDAEKLSWLVVGRASASGGAEAALVQQAALALLGSRAGAGKRGVAASLGLDEVSFRRDGAEGPAVTLGKRLGSNLYAAYERSLSGALGTLYVFYDLTRRVTVRAEAGTRTAVDLIFTFTFD